MKNLARRFQKKVTKEPSDHGDGDAKCQSGTSLPIESTRQELYGLFHLTEASLSITTPKTRSVKIVAVHGLNGDAFTTWTHSNGNLWLRDCLPASLPGCQVYSYGYPSQIFTQSYAGVRDYARHLLSCVRDLQEVDDNVMRTLQLRGNVANNNIREWQPRLFSYAIASEVLFANRLVGAVYSKTIHSDTTTGIGPGA